jgi:hypothetical protein
VNLMRIATVPVATDAGHRKCFALVSFDERDTDAAPRLDHQLLSNAEQATHR